MDVRIEEITSQVHITDARALLTPEVLEQIVEAVLESLRAQQQLNLDRHNDRQINRQSVDRSQPVRSI
jgi:hypothetical protein